ncbi:MAG: acyltransferase family protein [Terrimicrobiaceae bacterium]
MGILRLYLALCVVHAHAGKLIPWPAQDGPQAVQMFFMISGFYMSMVCGGRYGSVSDFYKSRALRIYIPYYFYFLIILAASICSGIFGHKWLALDAYASQPLASTGMSGIVAASVANVTIFGLDWLMFFDSPPGGGLHFILDFTKGSLPLYNYFVIPQCWSIGIELTFYAIVPFFAVMRKRGILGILLVLLGLRFAVYSKYHLDVDPWNYRFFPFELALFLAGMLAQKLYSEYCNSVPTIRKTGVIFLIFLAAAVVSGGFLLNRVACYFALHTGIPNAGFFSVLAIAPCLPVLFHLTRNSRMDRWLGELSYPIYLNHLILVLAFLAWIPGLANSDWLGILVALCSITWAAFANRFIFSPFEVWRHAIFGIKTQS